MRSFLRFVFVFSTVVVVCGVLFGLLSFWEFLAHRAGFVRTDKRLFFAFPNLVLDAVFFVTPQSGSSFREIEDGQVIVRFDVHLARSLRLLLALLLRLGGWRHHSLLAC